MKRILPFLLLLVCSQAEAKIFIKPFDSTGVKSSSDITLACDNNAILKYSTATSLWSCQSDSTGVGGGTAALEDYLIDVSAGGGVSVDTTEVSHDQTWANGNISAFKNNYRLSGGVASMTVRPAQWDFSGSLSVSSDFILGGASAKASIDTLVAVSHAAVTLAGENYLTLSGQQITANPVNLSGTHATGTLAAGRFPALTGDITNTAGTLATTISTAAVSGDKVATQGVSTDKFEATNKPTDGQVFSYNAAALKGKWVTSSAGSSAFSAITTGTNTGADMIVGTGALLHPSGSGEITATSGDSATTFFPSGTLEVTIGGTGKAAPSADAVLVGNSAGTGYNLPKIPDCSNATTSKLLYTAGQTVFTCGTDQNSGSATAWDAINDPSGNGAIAMGQTVQSLDWDSGLVSVAAKDYLTISAVNDAAADVSTQRLLTLENKSTSTTTLEAMERIVNNSATGVVTSGLLIDSAGGVITTAIDASDSDITTGLALGENDVTVNAKTISSTEFGRLDGTSGALYNVGGTDVAVADGGTGLSTVSNDSVLVGNNAGTGYDQPAIPNCTDSGGNHLNYTAGQNAFSCGTSSSGGGSGRNTNAQREFYWPSSALLPIQASADSIAPIVKDLGTNVDYLVRAFDSSATECVGGTFQVPANADTAKSITLRRRYYASTASATLTRVIESFKHLRMTNNSANDGSFTEVSLDSVSTSTTQDQITVASKDLTMASLSWVSSDLVAFEYCRKGNALGDDLATDLYSIDFSIEIPRSSDNAN